MGICKSVEIELPESWLELFAALKIAPLHVKQLLDVFHKMDIDESGSVDVVKLLKFLKVECTPFVERAFSMFDGDESGKVDFREFVLCLWDFCTTSLVSIDTFTFCLYEDSRVGFLTSGEVGEMLKDIYGKARLHEAPVKLIGADLHAMSPKATFHLQDFQNFALAHQALLFPVLHLQHHLRKSVLGGAFWKAASDHREELSKGIYLPLSDILQLHLAEGLYARAVRASNTQRMNSNSRSVIPSRGSDTRSDTHPVKVKPIVPPLDLSVRTANSRSSSVCSGVPLFHPDGAPVAATAAAASTAEHHHHPVHHHTAHHSAPSAAGHTTTSPPVSSHIFGDLQNTLASFASVGSTGSSGGNATASGGSGHHSHGSGHHTHHGSSSSGYPPSHKKSSGHDHHHKSRHGAVLSSTAAALDGDMHFNTSLKGKPVHATGRHITDVLGAQRKVVPAPQ